MIEVVDKATEELYKDLLNMCATYRSKYDLEEYHIIRALNKAIDDFSLGYES